MCVKKYYLPRVIRNLIGEYLQYTEIKLYKEMLDFDTNMTEPIIEDITNLDLFNRYPGTTSIKVNCSPSLTYTSLYKLVITTYVKKILLQCCKCNKYTNLKCKRVEGICTINIKTISVKDKILYFICSCYINCIMSCFPKNKKSPSSHDIKIELLSSEAEKAFISHTNTRLLI
jgi:hypothetical protein